MSEIPRCVLGVMVERTRLQLQTAWVEVLGPGSQRDLGHVIEVLFQCLQVLGTLLQTSLVYGVG